jgi:hypothetical protein
MRNMFMILAAMLIAGSAMGQTDKQAPPTGEDCLGRDYDCTPTNLTEEDYDNMPLSVETNRDLPALVELDPLDDDGALIKRYMLNARGIRGREVTIEGSENHFCTLSGATNASLTYFPATQLWVFVIDFSEEAELLAGGLATCVDLAQASARFGGSN